MQIQDFFREHFQMENEEMLRALEAIARLSATKRGELLIRENERPRDLFLLVDGVFRGYFYDDNGRDITECFAYRPGTPVMACTELGMPSTINLAALNDSVCLALPIDELRVLMVLYPDLLKLSNKLLLDSLQYHWMVKSLLYQYTAKQRYQWFCQTHPGLTELAGAKYVASFLNMTPVTLSRLRRELKEGENG